MQSYGKTGDFRRLVSREPDTRRLCNQRGLKRTMFKISIALRLFRYAAPLNKEGNSNMAKISIEMHTNGTPNPREWHSGRDVTSLTEN